MKTILLALIACLLSLVSAFSQAVIVNVPFNGDPTDYLAGDWIYRKPAGGGGGSGQTYNFSSEFSVTGTTNVALKFGQSALTLVSTNCTFDQAGGSFTNSYYLTATNNVYFVQPTNLIAGKDFTIFVRQDTTGIRLINFDTNYWVSANFDGSYYPALTNASAVQMISGRVGPNATNIYFVQSMFPR